MHADRCRSGLVRPVRRLGYAAVGTHHRPFSPSPFVLLTTVPGITRADTLRVSGCRLEKWTSAFGWRPTGECNAAITVDRRRIGDARRAHRARARHGTGAGRTDASATDSTAPSGFRDCQ